MDQPLDDVGLVEFVNGARRPSRLIASSVRLTAVLVFLTFGFSVVLATVRLSTEPSVESPDRRLWPWLAGRLRELRALSLYRPHAPHHFALVVYSTMRPVRPTGPGFSVGPGSQSRGPPIRPPERSGRWHVGRTVPPPADARPGQPGRRIRPRSVLVHEPAIPGVLTAWLCVRNRTENRRRPGCIRAGKLAGPWTVRRAIRGSAWFACRGSARTTAVASHPAGFVQ